MSQQVQQIEQGTTVKHLGLRDFQRSMYTHIKEAKSMPIILTKNKTPEFVVVNYKEFVRLHNNQLPTLGSNLKANGHGFAEPAGGRKPFNIISTNVFQPIVRFFNKKII